MFRLMFCDNYALETNEMYCETGEIGMGRAEIAAIGFQTSRGGKVHLGFSSS